MLKRHEVEILLKAGHGKAEVARLTGVSLCSVKRIAQEGPVVHVDDAAERAQRQVGRPSTVANFRKPILEILQHTPDLASLSNVSTADFRKFVRHLGIEVPGQSWRRVLPSNESPRWLLFQNILLVSCLNPTSWRDGEISNT
jgi:hypothetical protein